MRLKLQLSNEDFTALHDRVNRAEAKTQHVAVPKEALRLLLRDHAAVISEFKGEIGGNL